MLEFLGDYKYLSILFVILAVTCLVLIVYFIISLIRIGKRRVKKDKNTPREINYPISLLRNAEGRCYYTISNIEKTLIGTSRTYRNVWSCFRAIVNFKRLINRNIIQSVDEELKFGKSSILLRTNNKGQSKFVILNLNYEFFVSEFYENKAKCVEMLTKLKTNDFIPAIKSVLGTII